VALCRYFGLIFARLPVQIRQSEGAIGIGYGIQEGMEAVADEPRMHAIEQAQSALCHQLLKIEFSEARARMRCAAGSSRRLASASP